jgi:hypothetical protein
MKRFLKLFLAVLLSAGTQAASADEPLVVGMAQNLIPKNKRRQAEKVLEKLVLLVGQEVNYPTKLRLIPGGTKQAIVGVGNDLRTGKLHLAVFNGLEYGWMKQLTGGRVRTLVSSDQNIEAVQYEQLMIRNGFAQKVDELRGKSLVLYQDPYPSLTIYLKQLRSQSGATLLNQQLPAVPNGSLALEAVIQGAADATIVDLYTLQGYQNVRPGRVAQLQVLAHSPAYPIAPVFGDEQVVNKLRPNLWRDVQRSMTGIHRNPDAKAFLDTWRVRRFKLPTDEFEKQADKAAQDFPISEL